MTSTIPGDCLVLIGALIAVQAPLKMPRLRLPQTFTARRIAHIKRVKARAVAADEAARKQAALDAAMSRVYADADYEMRMARIENAPADAEMEEFYGNSEAGVYA